MTMTIRTETQAENSSGVFSRSFAINWEVVVFIAIFALAVFTRFYELGDRVMSHDESLHTRFSYNLYHDGDFQHSPLMHGPILFHAVALMYTLFGDNDFTARIYTAVLSVMLVMSPLLFRRWLGRWGTILASIMMLISPLLMYYGRYIREDMPNIISAVLMIWSIMMYLSGPENQQRKAHWLYILAASMLWCLGSKETAFIYIAIFGVFLFLYFVARLIQHFANTPGKPLFYTGMIGMLLGGVMALGMYIVFDMVPFDLLRATETTAFSLLAAGDKQNFYLWTAIVVGSVVLTLLGTLFWVYRSDTSQIKWGQVAAILAIALVVCLGFVVMEELSHTGDPAETTELIRWYPMIGLWLVSIVGFIFLFITRRKDNEWDDDNNKDKYGRGFWGTMDLFPEFDLIIVIGTLILPWSTAIFPYLMKGTEGDFANIARNLPDFVARFIGTYVPTIATGGVELTEAQLAQIGEFWLSFIAFVPLFALMVAIGLMWNWKRWLIASVIFHGLFAFFFTTVFTNVAGLGTGWVYSLGYWLEQQGVRRGSQPQYYYLLLIMPFYEFLPVIGGVLAMFTGTSIFWWQNKKATDVQRELGTLTQLAMVWRNDTPEIEAEAITEEGELAEDFSLREEIRKAKAQPPNDVGDTPLLAQAYDDANRRLRRYNVTVDSVVNDPQQHWRRLETLPFLLFFSWIAVLNLVGYSLAGEKMPWLGTHLTFPLIFLASWFFGRIFDRIDWDTFFRRGWAVQTALVVLIIGLFRSIYPLLTFDSRPFMGLSQAQLQATYGWIGAVVVTGIALTVVLYYADTVGWRHIRRVLAVAFFVILAGITFRSAWMASFINHDYANEFLVYAHSAPGVKWVLEDIRELSERITDGNDLRIAYDNEVSWPYSWYFRDFDSVTYVGENPTVQNLEDAVVIVVGANNRSKVEPIVEDRYVRFDHMRMWWPMQDYFNLTPGRIYNTFDLSSANTQAAQIRQGIFDIWWNRDYTVYGAALERDFTLENWPVNDRMHFYVRKDFAAQIWEYGIGEGGVSNPLNEIEENQCTSNWQALGAVAAYTAPSVLNHPIGVALADDGTLYVAEEFGHRVSMFNNLGAYLGSFGTEGSSSENAIAFNRPNSIKIGADGNLYIADTWNYRIQVLSPSQEFITAFGQGYTGGFESVREPVDGFWGPRDVAVSNDGLIYVADTGNKRVRAYRIIDGAAVHQFDVGEGGSALGQLDEPSGLVVHPVDGRLFVADTWNRRISVFTAEGVFLDAYRVRGWYEELGNRPYLAIDVERDLLYVTDPDSGRVLVYTTGGDCVGSFGQSAGTEATMGQFGIASGVAVDSEGYVYVADSELGRVLKFEPFPPTASVGTVIEPQSDPIAVDDAESTEEASE
jgi:predicted membrane-bound mannosyltransferase/DNA-binding beta-propeller fold protein YncE